MKWSLVFFSYILGSLPSGIIVAKLMGKSDPRLSGSGNIGTTNVLRTLGKKAAAATLLGDLLKGIIPVLLARWLMPEGSPFIYFAAAAAILGHDFSFLLHFKGGKGVATTVGALAALSPAVAALCLVTWLLVVGITRYSSAGALSAAAACPLFALVITGPGSFTLFCTAVAALLWFLHRENIKRLLDGKENRL